MNKTLKKRGIKKSRKTLGKPSQVAQLKKGILIPRINRLVLVDKVTGSKTKLKGSPKTKLKKARETVKTTRKRIKEGRVKL